MSEINLAKDAFSFLMQRHIAECMPDPVGEYLQALVARKAETSAEVAKAPVLEAPKQALPKKKSAGGWTPERRAAHEARKAQRVAEAG